MKDYAITILEYGVQIGFSNAMVFSGYYGDGPSGVRYPADPLCRLLQRDR